MHSGRDRCVSLLTWIAALYIAAVLVWYERYKLTGNEGSVWLFTTLSDWLGLPGHEKPFRLAVASAEILAAILVLIPRARLFGGLLALAIMTGAIFFHLASPLGIDPYGDGGALFTRACVVWLCAAFLVFVHRRQAVALARHATPRPPAPAR